ncbi:nicotinate dehydrogenase subunit A [Angulomicrobium tetraedrale]|uniref:Nicotinate dehydrogenase subunit A n=1 Tax=Ancylobacter tetraedralis TaxID=217068 RepID=A0A839Z9L2_9HYPH|nr:(2Fe-2S)-binding protein [Ancylobacter tetraedralis]MBB3771287.1 nicotinate dehydrogenase subunit A [Ancylobacter tetraedralis]
MTASTILCVNGRDVTVQADPRTPLLYVLRNDLGLNGPKYGCGLGECGACAVLIGDRAARSCTVPIGAVKTRPITTLEGLGTERDPHPVQAAFIAHQAAQCGYCLNGMIIATVALLRANPRPAEAEIRQALRHHLCRCGTHIEILAAVRAAAAPADTGDRTCGDRT